MTISKALKSKKVTTTFGIVAFIAGAIFLQSSMTGNVVIKDTASFEVIPLVGLALIFCSLVMAAYAIRKKK
jgi:uncharacterized membrane protein HdeD (DUF308 family)